MSKALLYELGRSKSFGKLSLKAKVLWPMLLAASDDQGRGEADPDVVKWTVCPNVEELCQDDIADAFSQMAEQGMIALYQDGRDRALYQIVRWWNFQQMQWAQPSKYEAPAGWTDRVRANVRNGQYLEDGWKTSGGFAAEPTEKQELPEPPLPFQEESPGAMESSIPGELPPEKTPGTTNQLKPNYQLKPSLLPGGGGEPPPAPPPRTKTRLKSEKKPTPAAVAVFRQNAHAFPPKAWWERVAEVIGDDATRLEAWGNHVLAWVGRGYNPLNIQGILESFDGGLDERKPTNARTANHRRRSNRPSPEQIASDRAALAARDAAQAATD